jgi:hypothetical protein
MLIMIRNRGRGGVTQCELPRHIEMHEHNVFSTILSRPRDTDAEGWSDGNLIELEGIKIVEWEAFC